MPGYTKEQLSDIFTYHDDPEAVPHYEAIRAKAKELAETIVEHTPVSADQTTAVRTLREAVMWANAAIALRGVS
jgi:hypothetical protein